MVMASHNIYECNEDELTSNTKHIFKQKYCHITTGGAMTFTDNNYITIENYKLIQLKRQLILINVEFKSISITVKINCRLTLME